MNDPNTEGARPPTPKLPTFTAAGRVLSRVWRRLTPSRARLCRAAPRLVLTLGVLVTLVVAFYTIENIRGRMAWNRLVAEKEAEGRPLRVEAYLPEEIPDEENFAKAELFREYEPFYDWLYTEPRIPYPNVGGLIRDWEIRNQDYQGTRRHISRRQTESMFTHANGFTTWDRGRTLGLEAARAYMSGLTGREIASGVSTPDAVLEYFEEFAPLWEALEAAAERPESRFRMIWGAGALKGVQQPFSRILPKLARWLTIRGICWVRIGDRERAFDNYMLVMRLAESLRSAPLLSSLRAASKIEEMGIQILWEGALSQFWTEAELKRAQERAASINWVEWGRSAVWVNAVKKSLWLDPEPRGDWTARARHFEVPRRSRFWLWGPQGWIHQNRVGFVEYAETSLELYDVERSVVDFGTVGLREMRGNSNGPYRFLLPHNADWIIFNVGDIAHAQAQARLVATGCAIERYRLREGRPPEDLNELVEAGFLDSEPLDPCGGDALRYANEGAHGYRVSSIARDGVNNGGEWVDHDKDWSASPDWVWRIPGEH